MKKIVLTAIFFIIFSVPAWAEFMVPHLSVYGTATTEVTPDEMHWSLKVSNRGPSLDGLAEQHSNIVLKVLALIKNKGVLKTDTQTSMMQFGENWEHQNGRRVQNGYFASSQISFKLTDFTKYQQLWIGLSKNNNISIQNIGYDYSKRIEAQDKARLSALLVARKKAQAMAKTLDVSLGNPLVIEDNQAAPPLRSNMLMANEAMFKSGSQDAGGFALGKISIRSDVKVVYQLKTPN